MCVIPARGGSKRVPRKNVKEFCGKPMIAWSIEAARASGCFDRIIVSTDDSEIAEVALDYKAEVPFVRPADLSDDHADTRSVVAHAISWQAENFKRPFRVCCIYATAPFIQAKDIRLGLEVLESSGAKYAFSVTSYPFPIQRAIRVTREGRVEMMRPSAFRTRSQDLEHAWHDAGQFYWGLANAWLEDKPIFSRDAAAIVLPRHQVLDIDTHEDWSQAELMFKARRLLEL